MSTATFSGGGAALDHDALDRAEGELELEFPEALRELYLRSNGGRPPPSIFVDARGDDYEVHSFKSFGEPGSSGVSIEETHRSLVARGLLPKDLVPIAMDSGGNLYCVDTSGAVFFLPMDVPDARAILIAEALSAFVERLVTAEEAYG